MLRGAMKIIKRRRKPGQLVKIALGNERYSLALVLKEPLIVFYDRMFLSSEIDTARPENLSIAFTLMVMNYAITSGRWPTMGMSDIPERIANPPKFCKKDEMSGKLSIYQEIPELAPHYERAAKPGECIGLEVAAVWEPEHVEDRLRDHYEGISNKWVTQLNIT